MDINFENLVAAGSADEIEATLAQAEEAIVSVTSERQALVGRREQALVEGAGDSIIDRLDEELHTIDRRIDRLNAGIRALGERLPAVRDAERQAQLKERLAFGRQMNADAVKAFKEYARHAEAAAAALDRVKAAENEVWKVNHDLKEAGRPERVDDAERQIEVDGIKSRSRLTERVKLFLPGLEQSLWPRTAEG